MRDQRDDAAPPALAFWLLAGLWAWAILGAIILGLVLAARALEGVL